MPNVEEEKMLIRYRRCRGMPANPPEYIYRGIFNRIQAVEHEGVDTKQLRSLEAQISRVHDPREREFLQNSLDYHLCGKSIGYPTLPDRI